MLYFAYGSNLSKRAMERRAPSARPLCAARLHDHRLTFESNEPPGAPDAYFANIRPCPGAFVQGALYEADDAALELLDDYEDVARGVYRRAQVEIVTIDGHRSLAVTYWMPVAPEHERNGEPSAEQIRQIREGYADWGLDLRLL